MSIVGFNTLIGLAIAGVALGSIRSMGPASDCAVRWAIVMIFVGSLGQLLGVVLSAWDNYLDTLFYGGVLALLIANQRKPRGVPADWSKWGAYAAVSGSIGAALVYWALS